MGTKWRMYRCSAFKTLKFSTTRACSLAAMQQTLQHKIKIVNNKESLVWHAGELRTIFCQMEPQRNCSWHHRIYRFHYVLEFQSVSMLLTRDIASYPHWSGTHILYSRYRKARWRDVKLYPNKQSKRKFLHWQCYSLYNFPNLHNSLLAHRPYQHHWCARQ